MKKIVITTAMVVWALTSCNTGTNAADKINQQNLDEAQKIARESRLFPKMTFEKTEHDFGKIKPGTHVETIFKFTNTGEVPLVITDASSTCGCTVPEKPKDPIAPGQTGEIKVAFNGSGQNEVVKSVTISANTENRTQTLTIKAMVKD